MSRTVFILGAGASRRSGGPLMFDFLDRAEDLLRAKHGNIDRPAFESVFEAVAQLQTTHSKAVLETLNVESVFAAFEMARLFGRLGTISPEDVELLPVHIATVIVQTVEHSVRMRSKKMSDGSRRFHMEPPEDYLAFAKLIKRAHEVEPGSVAALTFNYDVAADYALHYVNQLVNYRIGGLPESDLNPDLLKLHGSVNWGLEGEVVRPLRLIDYFTTYRFAPSEEGNVVLPVSSSVEGKPCIVPPTWSKLHRYETMRTVWRRAAAHLGEAENVIVMGYSLPPSDAFFRLLYALGTAGRVRLRRFWVFDPDDTGAVRGRFADLLGQAALARFGYSTMTFQEAVHVLARRWERLPERIEQLEP